MVVVSVIVLAISIILFLCTLKYKKTLRKKIDRRRHKLFFLYGMSMFLIDKIPKKWLRKEKRIDTALEVLSVKTNLQKEKYLYLVEKVTICIVIMFISFMIGGIVAYREKETSKETISILQRDSLKDTEYELEIRDKKGNDKTVNVQVAKKEKTEAEIRKSLKKSEKKIIETILGENVTLEHVDRPLHLIRSIGKENIFIRWESSREEILNNKGEISDSVSGEGEIVQLTAELMLEDVSEELTFSVHVFPEKKKQNMQSKVQMHIDQNNQYQSKVTLPEKIDGKTVTFHKKASEYAGYIFFIGTVAAIFIFFLKDRDIYKMVATRKQQLIRDYPDIISKILLYYGTGLSIKSVVERIIKDYRRQKKHGLKEMHYAYEELEIAFHKMNSGIALDRAMIEFGNRCGEHCYIKMANIITQNLKRGTKELTEILKNEAENAIREKRNTKLKEGGEISTKLLGPMVLMLIICMGIILIPALMSMKI